jgi:hypothetical protein
MTEETSDLGARLAESKGKHDEQLEDLTAQGARISEELADTTARLERAFGERTTELADALDEQRRVTQVWLSLPGHACGGLLVVGKASLRPPGFALSEGRCVCVRFDDAGLALEARLEVLRRDCGAGRAHGG